MLYTSTTTTKLINYSPCTLCFCCRGNSRIMESDDTTILIGSKASNKEAPLPDEFPILQGQVAAPGQPPPYFVIQQQQPPTQQANKSWIGGSQCSLPRKPVERRSFICPIVLSIVVLVTCGVVFGLVGLILASE